MAQRTELNDDHTDVFEGVNDVGVQIGTLVRLLYRKFRGVL